MQLYKRVGERYVRASQKDIAAALAARRKSHGPASVLTAEQKAEIRRRVKAGESQRALAEEYHVSESLVSLTVSRRREKRRDK